MTNFEFITFIDECIKQEILLAGARNENKLIGLRNIKSDFNYIRSNNPKLEALDILKKLYKERIENEAIYQNTNKLDLWLQEHTEAEILSRWIPEEPNRSVVIKFLSTLSDIPKQASSFKKFQDACVKNFGQKVDSNIILEFINES